MKRNLFIISIISIILYNCKKDEPAKVQDVLKITEGTYTGTFQCNNPSYYGSISNVSIPIAIGTSNTWEGSTQSEIQGY